MAQSIYEWCGDYFCSGCIVFALTEQPPWNLWLDDEDNDRSAHGVEKTLDLIAGHFGVPKNRTTRRAKEFPVRLHQKERPDGTHFCRACLTLLTMEVNHQT